MVIALDQLDDDIAVAEVIPARDDAPFNDIPKAKPFTQTKLHSSKKGVLYFDLETAPDTERHELFELDDIPAAVERRSVDEPEKNATDMLSKPIATITATLRKLNPDDAFLDLVESQERKSDKPRKGVFDLVAELKSQDVSRQQLLDAQRKTMSVSPEMCQIIAMGWKNDHEICNSMVVGVNGCKEVDILERFWMLARTSKQLCGFNILGFDLPVIFTRSIILDVAPQRQFDLKPWGNDVIDLMAKRWPKGQATGLKKLCRLLGIPIEAEGVDGSQAAELWESNPLKLGEYVRSDVALVWELYRRYCGFFC